jgi:hypothetical protein
VHTVYPSLIFFTSPSIPNHQSGPITMIPQPRAPLMPCVPLPLVMDFLFKSSSPSPSLPIESAVNRACFNFKHVCMAWLVDEARVLPDIVIDKARWRHSNCNSPAHTSLTKHLQSSNCMPWRPNRHALSDRDGTKASRSICSAYGHGCKPIGPTATRSSCTSTLAYSQACHV